MAKEPKSRTTKVHVNQKFGLLTVLAFVGVTPVRKRHVWAAVCDCGNEVVVKSQELLNGDTKSCGCLHREAVVQRNKAASTHGLRNSAEYRSWRGAKDRCFNPTSKDADNYSRRGITMCAEWAASFPAFLSYMGPKPGADFSLERLDVNGDYEPGNCIWANAKTQGNNRRTSNFITHNGLTMTLTEWAESAGMRECTLRARLFKQHLPFGEAISRPLRSWSAL